MSLIDTIPTTDATKPAALSQVQNGQLPASWLRSFDGTTRDDYKAFVPVSYAIQAMHLAAADDGITLRTTGRYRSLARQQALFAERYRQGDDDGCGSKVYNGVTYYLQRSDKGTCFAMAATPGTSNHGWGIADDFSEWDEGDPSYGSYLDTVDLQWLADNARSFFFALDVRSEPWHWHWYSPANPNTLSQRTVNVLNAAGIKVPSLAAWGFTVPGGSPPPPPPFPNVPITGKKNKMIVIRYGGTATAGWTGRYSFNGGITAQNVGSWIHWLRVLQCGAIDAKTGQPVTDPNEVTWVATLAEAQQYVEPF
jgi:hypothetical protein